MFKLNKKNKIVIMIAVVLFVAVSLVSTMFNPKDLSYLKFKEMVATKQIEKVKINSLDSKITVYTINDEQFKVENPRSDTFKEDLLNAGINVVEKVDKSDYISLFTSIGSLLFVGLFTVGTLNKGAGQTISKTNVSLDDVVGIDEIKDDIVNTIKIFKNKKELSKIGARPTRGIILYGDAGVGKTLLAKAIANYGDMNFISASGSDFVELYAGMGARKIRKLFKLARKKNPCVIFIDEIDAIGGKRNVNSNSERDQTINALLTELDGFTNNDNILVICATNRIDMLDEALIRPGRFDKHFYIPMPNSESRKQLIIKSLKNKQVSDNVDINELVHITHGMSGAKITTLMNEAAIISYLDDKIEISKYDIDKSFSKIISNGVPVKHVDESNIKIAAFHEAGHAICSKLLCRHEIYKISISSNSGGSGGITISYPTNIDKMQTKSDILKDVAMIYGGLVAEEIIFGEMSVGSSNDIEVATKRLHKMVDILGMGHYKIQYDKSSEIVLKQIESLSSEAYNMAKDIVSKHEDLLHDIADKLIEETTLNKQDVDDIFKTKTNHQI